MPIPFCTLGESKCISGGMISPVRELVPFKTAQGMSVILPWTITMHHVTNILFLVYFI